MFMYRLFYWLLQVIEPVVAQKSLVIAQRATIVQPLVRPVLGRHARKRERPPLLVAYCDRCPHFAQHGEVGMLRVKGAGQNNQDVRIFPSGSAKRACLAK